MFAIIHYPDLVQPGSGSRCEFEEAGPAILHETRQEAEKALLEAYPDKTLAEIMSYAQKRVEETS